MNGWEILARQDLPVYHYRPTSTANGRLRGLFRMGQMDASFGSHPLFEAVKCARRVQVTPFLIGSFVRYSGYLSWKLSGRKPSIPAEKAAFLRKEQLAKLGRWARPFGSRPPGDLKLSAPGS